MKQHMKKKQHEGKNCELDSQCIEIAKLQPNWPLYSFPNIYKNKNSITYDFPKDTLWSVLLRTNLNVYRTTYMRWKAVHNCKYTLLAYFIKHFFNGQWIFAAYLGHITGFLVYYKSFIVCNLAGFLFFSSPATFATSVFLGFDYLSYCIYLHNAYPENCMVKCHFFTIYVYVINWIYIFSNNI